jgi:hypothetical protein
MKRYGLLLIASAVALSVIYPSLSAQRRVTAVLSPELQGKNENKHETDSLDYSQFAQFTDEHGNVVYVDTVTGKEVHDTVPAEASKKMLQPLMYNAAVGVDIWDPLMRVFGQHYGLVEFSAELNLHNRYIPVFEAGLGTTDYTPGDNNYTYKVPLTPYFRIGVNYNFLYNKNPDYMAFAGMRLGWSSFKYEVNDVTLTSDYWDETAKFNLPSQTGSFTYIQVLFGIRVKVYGPISMGWNIRYKAKLHEGKGEYGKPWYIPGYGSRYGAFTGSFSVFYTLPLNKKHSMVFTDDKMPTKEQTSVGATEQSAPQDETSKPTSTELNETETTSSEPTATEPTATEQPSTEPVEPESTVSQSPTVMSEPTATGPTEPTE